MLQAAFPVLPPSLEVARRVLAWPGQLGAGITGLGRVVGKGKLVGCKEGVLCCGGGEALG